MGTGEKIDIAAQQRDEKEVYLVKLIMYNMEFGESFILMGENENLVIDLGSDVERFSYHPIIKDIKSHSSEKTTSLMLTHFHLDHIAGVLDSHFVKDMPPLSKVYMPNLLGVHIPNEFDLLKSTILEEVLDGVFIKKCRKQLSLNALLHQICDSYTEAYFLELGSEFSVDGTTYDVLWPDIHLANHINNKTLKRFYNWFESFHQENSSMNLFRAIEKYEAVLVSEFRQLTSRNNIEDVMNRYQQLDTLENDIWNTMELEYESMSKSDIELAKSLARSLKDLGNRLSIVFQDAHNNESGRLPILMTGDVPASILIKEIIEKGRCYKLYQVIKAPHHGTETHFTPKLPGCKKIAISNGQPNNDHKRFGRISYQYNTVYVSSSNPEPVQLCCSNKRCLLADSFTRRRKCDPTDCTCGIDQTELYVVVADW